MVECTIMIAHFLPPRFIQDDPGADKENPLLPPNGVVPSAKASEDNVIDNPYLRPVKKPKVRRKKWAGYHLKQLTHVCHSGWCFQQSSQWFPPRRGAAWRWILRCVSRDQRLLFPQCWDQYCFWLFLYTDWLLLKTTCFGCVNCHFFQQALTLKCVSCHFVSYIIE